MSFSFASCQCFSPPDKIVVGSFHGVLRVFHPRPEKTENGWSGFNPKDVLVEQQLAQPILQVELGRFIS